MSIRLGLVLLGLVAWGCDYGGGVAYYREPPDYIEPPANSYTSTVFQLHTASKPISVDGARVSDEFWSKTGARPMLGRPFVPQDYADPADQRVVALSHDLWEQSFHSDPSIIGRNIDLDGVPTTVVGILQPGFQFPEHARLWVPKTASSE